MPTAIQASELIGPVKLEAEPNRDLRNRHFNTSKVACGPSLTLDRAPLLFNSDVTLSLAKPTATDARFLPQRPGRRDDLRRRGRRECSRAPSAISPTARATTSWCRAASCIVTSLGTGPHRYLVFESPDYVRAPRRYRGEHGQLLEGAPYSERDFRVPENLRPRDEKGSFDIIVKAHDALTRISLDHHPFDVVGWDGYVLSVRLLDPRLRAQGRPHPPAPAGASDLRGERLRHLLVLSRARTTSTRTRSPHPTRTPTRCRTK